MKKHSMKKQLLGYKTRDHVDGANDAVLLTKEQVYILMGLALVKTPEEIHKYVGELFGPEETCSTNSQE